MYRYDENGQVTDMRLVDWQITRLGTFFGITYVDYACQFI